LSSHSFGTEPAYLHRVEGGPVFPDGNAFWISARSGRRLRSARFYPQGPARGSIMLSPGRTEPIEKYGEVASDLVGRGFAVVVHDWAGQGLSGRFLTDRLRGDMAGGLERLLADYDDVLAVHADHLPRPWIAMGHSMGAALTALALSVRPQRFAGAVLCAPMIEFSAGKLPHWLVRAIVATQNGVGRGTLPARKQLDPETVSFERNVLTHDAARYARGRALYRAHPELQLGEPTWRWLRFALELGARLRSPGVAEAISCPLAIVAAGDDRIVKNTAMKEFVARVPHGSYGEVALAFHEILMEIDDYRAQFWLRFDELADRVAPR
jgi:lysophospholipase